MGRANNAQPPHLLPHAFPRTGQGHSEVCRRIAAAQVDAAARSCNSSHFAVPISTRGNTLQYITPTWGPPTFCMDGTGRGRAGVFFVC